MVILTLLDPHTQLPQQQWRFDQDAVILIGRALENHVVLTSPLVSRRHLELRRLDQGWQFTNHGANGIYIAGQSISQGNFTETTHLQLARGGPILRCDVGTVAVVPVTPKGTGPNSNAPVSTAPVSTASVSTASVGAAPVGAAPVSTAPVSTLPGSAAAGSAPPTPGKPGGKSSPQLPPLPKPELLHLSTLADGHPCTHGGNPPDGFLCIHCGLPLRVERQIRQYQVLRALGRGGMGTTYLAWNPAVMPPANFSAAAGSGNSAGPVKTPGHGPGQDGLLVLKEMNANMVDIPKARELFEREATTLKTLDHMGIPRFYDFFVEVGKSYLAMELIHGQDLEKRVLQQGPVAATQAIAWMIQTCEILDYLHHHPQTIIHRDIKPGNLLVQTVTNRVVLLDFGAVTLAGMAVGTRIGAEGYCAPEQIQGRPMVQSDLYSIGPTLIFLLTGQKPQRFYRRRGEGFGFVVDEIPEIPPALKGVIKRLTELRPSDRYSSARELMKALAAC